MKEIAEIVGENPSSFWNWARERTDMPNSVLAKIAAKTDYFLDWILTGVGPRSIGELKSATEQILDQAKLENFVRRVVREELGKQPALMFDSEEDEQRVRASGPRDKQAASEEGGDAQGVQAGGESKGS